MKHFTTKNILIEVTREELELLDTCLNSAYLRMEENNWSRTTIQKVSKMWYDIMEIKKSLPF